MLAETLRRPLSFAGRVLGGLGALLFAALGHAFFQLVFSAFKFFFALRERAAASRSERPFSHPTLPTTETAEPLLAVRR